MKQYLRHYRITSPSYMVAKRSAEHIRAHACEYLTGRLLDIGCGSKWKQDLVGDLVAEYVGLDHEGSMHDSSVVDIFGAAWEIPQPDESYDSVLCTSVLEHLEEPERALQESFRVLKRGGYALYTVPFFWHIHEQPRDFFRYTRYGLDHLFRGAGYEVVVLEPLSGFWLTFASECGYYLTSALPRVLRPLAKAVVLVNNLVVPFVDRWETRYNKRSSGWTWLYLVVARKPGERSG